MREAYGTGFVSIYGATPNDAWMVAIANLTDEEISTGLHQVIERSESYPPNVGEFTQLCRPEKPNRPPHLRYDTSTALKLEHKPEMTEAQKQAARERAEKHIEKMREKLR